MMIISKKKLLYIFSTLLLLIIVIQFFSFKNTKKEIQNRALENKIKKEEKTFLKTYNNKELYKKQISTKKIKDSFNRENFIKLKKEQYQSILKGKNQNQIKLFEAIFNNDYTSLLILDEKGIKFKDLARSSIILKLASYFVTDTRILDLFLLHELTIISDKGINCFQTALESRNFFFLEYFILEKGFNINYNTKSISLKLAALGDKELEKWVKNLNGNYNDFDKTNFLYTIKEINQNTLEKYIDEGFTFTDKHLSKLISLASIEGNIETLSYIKDLSTTLDIKLENRYLNNTIQLAIESSKNTLPTIKWLVENDYDINWKNQFDENALGVAVRNKKEDVILYLIENYLNPNERLTVRKILNDSNLSYETKRYENLYLVAKEKKLKKVQYFLEENYGY